MVKKTTKIVERKTFIKGKFKGKYWSDYKTTSISQENLVSGKINLKEGTIYGTSSTMEAEYENCHDPIDEFGSFFQSVKIEKIDSSQEYDFYEIHLHNPKISNVKLSLIQNNGDETFGSIEFDVLGYILIKEVEEVWVEEPKITASNQARRRWGAPKRPVNRSKVKKGWSFYDSKYFDFGLYITIGILAVVVLAFLKKMGNAGIGILALIIIRYLIVTKTPRINNVINSFFKSIATFLVPYISGILLFVIGLGIFQLFTNQTQTSKKKISLSEDREKTSFQYDSLTKDTMIIHHRIWRDYNYNQREMDIKLLKSDFKFVKNSRKNIRVPYSENSFWGNLYSSLEHITIGKLDSLVSQISSFRKKENLEQKELLELVGTLIQDIPYSYILEEECKIRAAKDKKVRNLLKECPSCCVGNVLYGVYSPVEFMATLKGDCDTRTLLAHYLLKNLGYDVAILNSDLYRHSMLGVNLPYTGKFKSHLGNRYYFWELTSKGHQPGDLSTKMRQINKWKLEFN